MKFPLASALFFLVLAPAAMHAQDAPPDPTALPAAVAQLFTDLAGISAGSTVSDAQHQALVADLDALAAGVFTPDPDDIDQLATDLGSAATSGLLTSDFETELAADFWVDPSDPDDQADGWLDDIEDDVDGLIRPVDVTDPITTILPTYVLAAPGFANASTTHVLLPLTAQGIPPFLLENYTGSARLMTSQTVGAAAVAKITVRTSGLPRINPYTVSVQRQSDGSTVVLGELRVRNGFGRNPFLLSALPAAVPAAELLTSGRVTFGGPDARHPLPAGFDPADVASVTVTDSQGTVRLSGSVAGAEGMRQASGVTLRLLPSAVSGPALTAYADAVVRHVVTVAGTSDRFHLAAHHLPASTTVTLLVNGTAAGQFPTSAKGRLVIAEGPTASSQVASTVYPLPAGVDLSAVKSLSLTDAQGDVLVSASLDE